MAPALVKGQDFDGVTAAVAHVQRVARHANRQLKIVSRSSKIRKLVCVDETCPYTVFLYPRGWRRNPAAKGKWFVSSVTASHALTCSSHAGAAGCEHTPLQIGVGSVYANDQANTNGTLDERGGDASSPPAREDDLVRPLLRLGYTLGTDTQASGVRCLAVDAETLQRQVSASEPLRDQGVLPLLRDFVLFNPGSHIECEYDDDGDFVRAFVASGVFTRASKLGPQVFGFEFDDRAQARLGDHDDDLKMYLFGKDGNLDTVVLAVAVVRRTKAVAFHPTTWFFECVLKTEVNVRDGVVIATLTADMCEAKDALGLRVRACSPPSSSFGENGTSLSARIAVDHKPLYGCTTRYLCRGYVEYELRSLVASQQLVQPVDMLMAVMRKWAWDASMRRSSYKLWLADGLQLTPMALTLWEDEAQQLALQSTEGSLVFFDTASESEALTIDDSKTCYVNWDAKLCSCAFMEQLRAPCRHLIALMNGIGDSLTIPRFDDVYRLKSYGSAYRDQEVIVPFQLSRNASEKLRRDLYSRDSALSTRSRQKWICDLGFQPLRPDLDHMLKVWLEDQCWIWMREFAYSCQSPRARIFPCKVLVQAGVRNGIHAYGGQAVAKTPTTIDGLKTTKTGSPMRRARVHTIPERVNKQRRCGTTGGSTRPLMSVGSVDDCNSSDPSSEDGGSDATLGTEGSDNVDKTGEFELRLMASLEVVHVCPSCGFSSTTGEFELPRTASLQVVLVCPSCGISSTL